jgi:hypothetical protein
MPDRDPEITRVRDPDVAVPEDKSNATFEGVLENVIDSAVVINVENAMSIGFHIQPPVGSAVLFEGSWNGDLFTPVTFRSMGADGYAKYALVNEDYIGSVATFKYVRLRVVFVLPGGGHI